MKLYIDIGGSYIKFLFQEKISRVEMVKDSIISIKWIKKIILDFIQEINDVTEICFSCQMHGYVIEDTDEFITWKKSGSIPDFIEPVEFTEKTGLFLRNDLPICNLYHYLKNNKQNHEKIKILHISEALCDEKYGKCTREMACGTGFFDIHRDEYIYIDEFKKEFNINLLFDEISSHKEISGLFYVKNKKIPCHPGIGDMQCSLFGTNLLKEQICINMATGSQISQITEKKKYSEFELRPYFGNFLKCITHIPSGRFLLYFEKLIPNLFEILSKTNIKDLKNSNIIFDLNFENIIIKNLKEDNINVEQFCYSLLRNYLEQYDMINKFDFENILLSGGIPKKISVIKDYFLEKFNKDVILNNFDDDSLLGLKKLYL